MPDAFTSNLYPLLTVFLLFLSPPSLFLPRSVFVHLYPSPQVSSSSLPCLLNGSFFSVPLILFLNVIPMSSTLTSLRTRSKVKCSHYLSDRPMNDDSKLGCQVPRSSCSYTDLQVTTHPAPHPISPGLPEASQSWLLSPPP